MHRHVCLMPEHHNDFLDSFPHTGITERAQRALTANRVQYNEQVIHFPRGGIHPGHNRKFVMFPDENDTIHILRHWGLPDGTVIRHSSQEGIVDIDPNEKM